MFIIQYFYPVSLGFIFISYISTLLEGLNLNLRRLNFINELPVGKGQKLAEKVKGGRCGEGVADDADCSREREPRQQCLQKTRWGQGGEEGLPRTYGLRPEKESNGRGNTLKNQLVFVNNITKIIFKKKHQNQKKKKKVNFKMENSNHARLHSHLTPGSWSPAPPPATPGAMAATGPWRQRAQHRRALR